MDQLKHIIKPQVINTIVSDRTTNSQAITVVGV